MKYTIRILIGTGLTALAVKCVYEPTDMVIGGFSGVAIVLRSLFGLPLGVTTFMLNIPVYFAAWKMKGFRFVRWSAMATVSLSLWLSVIPSVNLSQSDRFIAAVFGGFLCGCGTGLVMSCRATTGGTDMVAALIHTRLGRYSVVEILQVLDGLIVIAGLYLFGIRAALYSIIAVLAAAKMSDFILEGANVSRSVFVISDRSREVARAIMEKMQRGVTGLPAKGMYSDARRCMLYCVVSKREIVKLKEIILNSDPEAFVIVNDASEVLGEGFLAYKKEEV